MSDEGADRKKEYNRAKYLSNVEANRAKAREYYYKNREKIKERRKATYKPGDAKYQEYRRQYYAKNKEKMKSQARENYHANKERRKEQHAKWAQENAESIRLKRIADRVRSTANKAAWRERNREQVNQYMRERRLASLHLILTSRLQTRLKNAIQAQPGAKKIASTFALVGCSPADLRRHLETQFAEGMSWDNRAEWEIDHIRPCSSFDLTDSEEQRKCFHYTNLQPLWKSDNRSKSDMDPQEWERRKQERELLDAAQPPTTASN